MPAPHTLLLFAPVCLGLLVIPGPAVLYIVTRSIDQGRSAGVASVLGIHTGSLVHVAAAAAGLSALLVSSAVAFSVLKYAGAVYLVVLGVRKLLERDDVGLDLEAAPTRSLRRIYAQGIVVNILNPKTALFFLAFLPQFVDVDRGAVWSQMVVLGFAFIALGMLSDGTYAFVAARAGRLLRSSRRFRMTQRYVSGGIYIGLGAVAALAGSHHSE
jgi:threonine/homoserine/homoserine lactone efflux protein